MLNPASHIRKQVYAVISTLAEVWEDGSGPDDGVYVILGDLFLTGDHGKDAYKDIADQAIEVVGHNTTREAADGLADVVMGALTGIGDNADFQFISVKRQGQRYITETSAQGGTIHRIVLTYRYIISHKNRI